MTKHHSIVRTLVVFTAITFFLGFTGLVPTGCGGANQTLEEAEFFLDQCNATIETSLASNCTPALNAATEVLTSDPTNVNAALISSSASIGLARFDMLSFLSDLSSLSDSNGEDFSQFQTFISDFETDSLGGTREIDLSSLQNAKDVLSTLLATATIDTDTVTGVATDPLIRRASFQLGLIQAIDAFIRPVKLASGGVSHVADITSTEASRITTDYINADNNLLRGGLSGDNADDILTPLRENYCRCSLQTIDVTDQTCLQDQMRCQLYNTAPSEDYDGAGGANIADCAELLTPDGLAACAASNTH